MHDIGATEDANIDVLDRHMAQDNTGNNDGRDSDSVGNLAEEGACGA